MLGSKCELFWRRFSLRFNNTTATNVTAKSTTTPATAPAMTPVWPEEKELFKMFRFCYGSPEMIADALCHLELKLQPRKSRTAVPISVCQFRQVFTASNVPALTPEYQAVVLMLCLTGAGN